MGNQTSQWFALYFLDPLDRLVKERLRIKHYTRYMDDLVLLHPDKNFLRQCLHKMQELLQTQLLLKFNEKTQIFPIRCGVEYLGFRFSLTNTGKVIRRLKKGTQDVPEPGTAGLAAVREGPETDAQEGPQGDPAAAGLRQA